MEHEPPRYHDLILLRTLIIVLPALLATIGCETPQTRLADADVDRTAIAFLQEGTTTRTDTLLALGEPSERFEDDGILTYLLSTDSNGTMHVVIPPRRSADGFSDWPGPIYSLVLVFDARGVLERHSLVRIHG